MSYITDELKRIERRYNPENDLIPNAPRVTYTDHVLIEVIKELLERVEKLENENATD
jgi:hypothetical protein